MRRLLSLKLSLFTLTAIATLSVLTGLQNWGTVHATAVQKQTPTEGSLQAVDPQGRERGSCPLKHTDVKAEISGFLSRVTVTQEFENPFDEKIEAVYVFPLPQSAAVDDMTMQVGQRTIRGKIMRREEAQAAYNQARSRGQVASLLDQERPNIFTQSVANIMPGAQVKVIISYVETLRYENGTYGFSFPMVVGNRYLPSSHFQTNTQAQDAQAEQADAARLEDDRRISPTVMPPGQRAGHDISIEVKINAGVPLESVSSSTHEVVTEMQSTTSAIVRLKNLTTIPNRDFLLKYKVAGRRIEDALLAHADERGRFFTFILQPPERVSVEDVTPKELVFVLDTSGSMGGFPIEKAKETMKLALDGLYPQDTFNLITFAGDTHVLFPEPVPATPENLSQAKSFLSGRYGEGGTEMMDAIKAALAPSDSEDHVRIVCFMTDGVVGNDMEILSEIQKHPNARIFAMGFGDAPNRFLLDHMAQYGRGEVEYVTQSGNSSNVARRFHERVRNPLLTDISIDWGGLPVTDVYPQKIPDLFGARPVTVSGRYTRAARGTIRLKGKMAGQDFVREIPINLPESESDNDALASLWARRKIDDLMDQVIGGIQTGSVTADQREEITKLGLEYRLMTQFTSFVAIEETPTTDASEPVRVDVPAESPASSAGGGDVNAGGGGAVAKNITTVNYAGVINSLVGGTVTVVGGSGVEVNTQTEELSNTVSSTQIRELPVITRNPYSLAALAGNVTEVSSGAGAEGQTSRGVGVAINGQRAASTNILLDGGENVDAFNSTVGQSVPFDSMAEFRIITNNFSAEYGRATGGIVNVATRAGTNEFHSTVYEFNRVSALASNSFENNSRGIRKPNFTRNQFGYSLSGPLMKNKLFFFSSTEWTRVRGTGITSVLVPTAQLIAASNLRTQAVFAANALRVQPSGPLYTAGQIQQMLRSAGGQTPVGAFFSLPANLPAFATVNLSSAANAAAGDPQNSYSTVGRIDYNASDHTQLYGRFAIESRKNFAGSNSFSPYDGYDTGSSVFNQNHLLNLTHSFSSTVVSQTKLVFNRLDNEQPLGRHEPAPSYYLRSSLPLSFFGTQVALPGYFPLSPARVIPAGGPQNLAEVAQDFTYTRGNHTFRIGGQYIHIEDNRAVASFLNARESFGTENASTGLNNFVDGNLRAFQVAINSQGQLLPGSLLNLPIEQPSYARSNRYNEWAAYFNDAWRFTQRLTFNLGLRYEYYGVQHNKNPLLDSNFYFGQGASIFEMIQNGSVQPAASSAVGGLWRPDWNNFAPRVGFAWDVNGDGRTSLRAGYGIAYDRNFGNVTFGAAQNPPAYAVVTVTSGDAGFQTIPVTVNNLGPLSGSAGNVALAGRLAVRHVDQNIVNAYAHTWSVSFEREVMQGTVASVFYSGSLGRKLYDLTNLNRPGYGCIYLGRCGDPLGVNAALGVAQGTFSSELLNPNYYPIESRGNRGRSNYNALVFSLEGDNFRRQGLKLMLNYTLSVARDNLSSTLSDSANNFNLGLLDPFNPALDYGYAESDARHRISGNFDWELPFAKSARSVKGQLFSGWMLAGVFTARAGLPFTVYDCSRSVFNICPRVEANGLVRFSGEGAASDTGLPNLFRYINLSSLVPGTFFNPVTGTSEVGPFPSDMTKRNQFRAPGYWNFDLGLYKNFKLSEGAKLQLRAEFYNLFNHSNLYVVYPTTDISMGSYIQAKRGVTNGGANEQRNIQLALKLIF